MATQITFSDDVTSIATAENDDGSIRWHFYTRVIADKPAVFVRRQTGGVLGEGGNLEAEVLFMQEGTVFSATFNSVRAEFDLVYEMNEVLFLVTIGENDLPATQVAQIDVFFADISFKPGKNDPPDDEDTLAISKKNLVQSQSTQVYAGSDPSSVTVTASSIPGNLKVRWNPDPTTQVSQIVGFNVYVLEKSFGQLIKINNQIIPFVEQTTLRFFEFEVPARAGKYLVTQIDSLGSETGVLRMQVPFGLTQDRAIEGRKFSSAEVLGNGKELAFAASDLGSHFPGGKGHQETSFVLVDQTPIFLGIQQDTLTPHFPGGEGHTPTVVTFVDQTPVLLQPEGGADLFELRPGGEGIRSSFTLTGFDPVIVT